MANGEGACGSANRWRGCRSGMTYAVEVNKWSQWASWSCMGAKTINEMKRGAPKRAGHGEVPMAAMVAWARRQLVPKAIVAVRGGYGGSRSSTRTRRSWEHRQLGEDGTTAMNFTVERHGGALAEKRDKEEHRRCSPIVREGR